MEKVNCEYKSIWPDTDIILVNINCPGSDLKSTVNYNPKIHKMSFKDKLKMYCELHLI